MREKVRDMLFLVVLLLVWPVPVGALIVFGSEPHQSFALDDGEVVLHIAGRCSFASHVDSTGARNQTGEVGGDDLPDLRGLVLLGRAPAGPRAVTAELFRR